MIRNSLFLHRFILKNVPRRFLSRFQQEPETEEVKSEPDRSSFVAIKLENKRLLRVSGSDSFIYLQSLLTNDMRQLLPVDRLQDEMITNRNIFQQIYALNQPLIYSYICSAVGKVLCDLFVYRMRYRAEEGEFILEVDADYATAIKRLLLGHNLSRNVKVELADDFDLWTLIPENSYRVKIHETPELPNSDLVEIDSDDIKLVNDPRIRKNNVLGYRFLTRLGGKTLQDIGKYCKAPETKLRLIQGSISDYHILKYRFGISEGFHDHLSGHYFPFELNGDILNAVSLNKGLYTSEEKIIKIYSTDGIKRRIFPVVFSGPKSKISSLQPAPRTILNNATNGKKFGMLHYRIGRYGIATLPVPVRNSPVPNHESKMMPMLSHNDTGIQVQTKIPFWWPHDLENPQLPIPEYPKSMFNFTKVEEILIDQEDLEGLQEDKQQNFIS